MVSTLITNPLVGGLTLPAASVAVTVRVCRPSPSGLCGVKIQALSAPTSAVPSRVAPS